MDSQTSDRSSTHTKSTSNVLSDRRVANMDVSLSLRVFVIQVTFRIFSEAVGDDYSNGAISYTDVNGDAGGLEAWVTDFADA